MRDEGGDPASEKVESIRQTAARSVKRDSEVEENEKEKSSAHVLHGALV